MEDLRFAGALIRMHRLARNWSQETLCAGICAVSYLSKIEQGKADANDALLRDLFTRLELRWESDPQDKQLTRQLYEGIFAWDTRYTEQLMNVLEERCASDQISPYHLDYQVLRAYCLRDPERIPGEMLPLLSPKQRCLLQILRNEHAEAYRNYPCALTAFCVAEEAFHKGNYTYALEYLQIAFDQASREGYAHMMLYCQHYMANCYSDIGNLEAMHRHNRIAARLGRALGEWEVVETIAYNTAATQLEYGDYEQAYHYFGSLQNQSVMTLHKLAIACEGLGESQEAISALDRADQTEPADKLDRNMCAVVRYRLEHPGYLRDPEYGRILMDTFAQIRRQRHFGYARFHLPWVTQWLTANRKYREAYELMADFPGKAN